MTEYERIRKELLGFDGIECATCSYDPCPFNEKSKMLCPAEVDYILSLVEIRATDQSLPDLSQDVKDAFDVVGITPLVGRAITNTLVTHAGDILKAGFVKVIPKGR